LDLRIILEFANHHRRAAKTRAAALIHTRPSKLTIEAPLVALVDLVVGVVEAAESVSVIEEGRDEELDELGIVAGVSGPGGSAARTSIEYVTWGRCEGAYVRAHGERCNESEKSNESVCGEHIFFQLQGKLEMSKEKGR